MKTHGPKSPQTVRGLRDRRSLRADLDARRYQESDLRIAEVVQPFGNAYFKIKNSGGSQEYIVKNHALGRTFSPGSKVVLGSEAGSPGEVVLGGSPPGKSGGVGTARNRRRRGTATVGANQYAFGMDGDNIAMHALLYSDGTFVSERGSSVAVSTAPVGCIVADSSALVGDGSMLGRTDNTMQLWNVEDSLVYSYSAATGWRFLAGPYYQNGRLYFFEGEDSVEGVSSFDVRLRSAATDLTDVTTLETVTLDISDAQADLGGSVLVEFMDTFDYAAGMAVDSDGAVVYFGIRPQDANSERTDVWPLQFRFLLSGGAPTSRAWSSPESTTFIACTLSAGGFALCLTDTDSEPAVFDKGDNATTGLSYRWDAATLDGLGFSSISVGTLGSTVQVHSTAGYLVRDASIVTSTIDAYNETPDYPAVMFYFGE